MHYVTLGFIAIDLVILILATTCSNITCPAQCECSRYDVKCIGKDLRTIPKGIPLTAISIDLSYNPKIEIPRDYFLQFEKLARLVIIKCGQKGPVYLPNSLRDVRLDDNYLTVNALKEMFSEHTKALQRISIGNNRLQSRDMKKVMVLLPMQVKYINATENNLRTLTRAEMMRFKEIKKLQIEYCSLESIEANALDHLRHLSTLKLNGNKLGSLPDSLFKFNSRLSTLQLKKNKLTEFNVTKLGIRHLKDLRLGENRIAAFDIQGIRPTIVTLNDNNIGRLEAKKFLDNPKLWKLDLSNNNIQYLDGNAFQGMKKVSQLLMNNISLKSLQKGLFKGMTINNIFLKTNRFSSFKGVFQGMKMYPYTVAITNNTRYTLLNGKEFQSLPNTSQIYITCTSLKRLTNLWELKAKVECSPIANKTIHIASYQGFSCKGYQCKLIPMTSMFKCRACNPGYHSSCKGVARQQSICVKCPPGSYYQDEAASVRCKTCRPGQFVPPERSPGTDVSDCKTCPKGTNTTILAGTRACKCLIGFSRRYRFGPCTGCTDKGFNCSQDYPVLHKGYWMTWEGTKPEHAVKFENQKLPQRTCKYIYREYIKNLDITDDTYYRETMHFNCQMPIPIKCPMKRSCAGGIEIGCSAGYSGVLCAVCKRGYSRELSQCVQCPRRAWAAIKCVSSLALFGIVCLIISSTDKITVGGVKKPARGGQTANYRTFANILLSSLKILIGFYQLLISIIHGFSYVNWPDNVKRSIDILQYTQFEIIKFSSLRCINSEWNINAIDKFWIILILYITVPLLAAACYFIKRLYIYCTCSSPSEGKRKRFACFRHCVKCVALFLFVTYTFITTNIIEMLPISCHSFCTAKQHGKCVHSMSFLRADYSIPCPTMEDNRVTLIIGYSCLLIIPLGLPILLWLLLGKHAPRQRTDTQFQHPNISVEYNEDYDRNEHFLSMDDDLLSDDSHAIMMKSALKFTYENYHSRYWYWEVIEMIRKLLMTICIVLFVGHIKIGLACTIIVAMLFTILHAIYKPFKSKFESGAQYLSLILIPLNLAFGALLQLEDKECPGFINKQQDYSFLSSMIVAMNSALVVMLVLRIIGVIMKWLKSRENRS